MSNSNKALSDLGVHIPKIMIPGSGSDFGSWSVVACDQYTSERSYWKKVEEITSGKPSTLNIIFPEVYLEDSDSESRISKINKNMKKYMEDRVITELENSFILVDRKTSRSKSRKGLMLALDLECYDYTKGSNTLIRATEGTVIERLPPRIKIRQKASIELPHIMVLIDDPDKTVIEPLFSKASDFEKLYDFELMMDGGHIKGYKISDEADISSIANALSRLAQKDVFREKYSLGSDENILLFAVGDGNHSLASAKGHWENVKASLSYEEQQNHPARFALVELVNVHDDGLVFEPIHRVLFNVNADELINAFGKFYSSRSCSGVPSCKSSKTAAGHTFRYITAAGEGSITINNPANNLEVGTLQVFLDCYMKSHPEVKIDYIHGDDVVEKLGSQPGNMGFYLPPMNKTDLFKTVILDGALPRKTFSMGEAEEKRFYLECRKIR
ncbi:uncharacterized protein (DUF1015 family) [Ruminiclostridium sufflavum DSM 19573]|uniref:Uncharacterized protein (DUF1015 family) n=1 Tax=Ruminiclostridium sufflavum DSM 19573 TaxID=1121337 RepID=A0A318XJE1_9FIRM|nr:DUF1015 domain-containing protein [Ruminiclostridium sufflavum]PYG87320.1 uncharacterized protein (DUF1015 family) [Ruminiclostridium sufflavum DSM 19573]